jgi:hypothetical protein
MLVALSESTWGVHGRADNCRRVLDREKQAALAGIPEPVRGGGEVAQRRACLPHASAPEVPFCAAAMVATAVVLARRSEVGRRREIADSKCADISRHSQSLWSPGASFEPEKSHRRPCWSRKLHAPGTAHRSHLRLTAPGSPVVVLRGLTSLVAVRPSLSISFVVTRRRS